MKKGGVFAFMPDGIAVGGRFPAFGDVFFPFLWQLKSTSMTVWGARCGSACGNMYHDVISASIFFLVSTYLFVRCNNHKCVIHLCEEVTSTD